MERRFIDKTKWKALRKLDASLKTLYFYCWCQADACGVYVYDDAYMLADLGKKYPESSFDNLKEFLHSLGNGKYLFPDFINVCYGEVKQNYNPHKPIFRALQKHDLKLAASLNEIAFKLEYEYKNEYTNEYKNENSETEKKKKRKLIPSHLFSESEFYDFEKFSEQFTDDKYKSIDIQYYYESIRDWSAGKGEKRVDWIATARTFMNKDRDANKLKKKQSSLSEEERIKENARIFNASQDAFWGIKK